VLARTRSAGLEGRGGADFAQLAKLVFKQHAKYPFGVMFDFKDFTAEQSWGHLVPLAGPPLTFTPAVLRWTTLCGPSGLSVPYRRGNTARRDPSVFIGCKIEGPDGERIGL